MKTKKLILGIGISLMGTFAAHAQVGLEGIIVEKYYKADAADAASGTDPVTLGAVTYRVYADLAAGYELQALYGEAAPFHELKLETTTSFFNNQDRGAVTANGVGNGFLDNNTVAIDSWFSMGAASSGNNMGVLKSEDDGAANLIHPHTDGLMANSAATIGIPLTTQDGIITGTPESVTFVGLGGAEDIFGATGGNSFITSNGSVASLNGSVGPNASNKVLIGQFTTDGIFTFELNLQVGLASGGGVEKYVAINPQAGEFTHASLMGTFGTPPSVSISSPAAASNHFVGNTINIAATAADEDGTVASVEFFLDGVSIGTDVTSAFTATTTLTTAGSHTLTATAIDNDGNSTTSANVIINGVVNALPTVSITAPTGGAVIPGALGAGTTTVTITANAADSDGSVDSVEFYVNAVKVGVDASSPYSFDWISSGVFGGQSLTAKAFDNDGGSQVSAAVAITISNPNAKPYFVNEVNQTCVETAFCLPIHAKDSVKNVIGFDMVLHYDKAKVTPTGIIAAGSDLIANPAYVTIANNIDAVNATMNISVSLNNAAPINTFFDGIGELICVGFNKTAGFASIDTASFTVDSIIESRYTGIATVLVDAGKFITYRDSTFHASLKFWADNSAIKYDTANPASYLITNILSNNLLGTSPSADTVQPNTTGNFDYVVNQADLGDLSFNIERDIDALTSVQPVVNGFDALLARKVIVSDLSFIPSVYQMIAMDVNMDGVISAGDVTQMNQRSVLSIPEFKQQWNYNANGTIIPGKGSSKDWVFIDETTLTTNGAYMISSIYPSSDGVGFSKNRVPVVPAEVAAPVSDPTGCPVINAETFTGVMLGDVNGNYKSIASDGILKSLTEDKIVFDLSNAVIADGIITIPVSIVSDATINALDFAMLFNENNLSYDEVVNHAAGLVGLGNLNEEDLTLRFTSYSLENLDTDSPIVSVSFAIEGNEISKEDLISIEGYLNGEKAKVEVIDGTPSAEVHTSTLVAVYPNPATDVVNVIVSENASVQIFTVDGSLVVETAVAANQTQVINTENLANGVYTIRIANENFVEIKKLVIAK